MSDHNPWVTITHPKTGGVYECPESSLPHYKSLGWRRVTKSSTEAPATAADSTSTPRKRGTSKKKEQRNG